MLDSPPLKEGTRDEDGSCGRGFPSLSQVDNKIVHFSFLPLFSSYFFFFLIYFSLYFPLFLIYFFIFSTFLSLL